MTPTVRHTPPPAGGRAVAPPPTWPDGSRDFPSALLSPWHALVVDVEDVMVRATYEYGHGRGLKAVQLPVTTRTVTCPSGLGSDSRPVSVDVGGKSTYLSDSAQFLLEYGCRVAPAGCYTILPSLRADTPDPTHLSEFVHIEAEIAGDLDDLIGYVEGYVRHLAGRVLDSCGGRLREAIGDVSHLERAAGADRAFVRVTFAEAAALLDDDPALVEDDGVGRLITRCGERRLMEELGDFVWVTHFDHLSVPFYQAFGDEESLAVNADLLFGVGEVVGGGQRHTTGADVRRALALHDVPQRDYAWYVQMKDLAPMPTAGFGIGAERYLLWVLRHDDIRDIPLVSRVGESAEWPDSVDRP
jgi:asparaginyl-tRNA synthetase